MRPSRRGSPGPGVLTEGSGTATSAAPEPDGHDVGDHGSVLVVTLLFFVLALLLVMGVSAASAAFAAQRDLASVCDSAAVAAATAVDLGAVYGNGVGPGPGDAPEGRAHALAVDPQLARRVVAEYLATAYADVPHPVSAQVAVSGSVVAVECRATVTVPFGSAFGYADGLPRVARAHARTPVS